MVQVDLKKLFDKLSPVCSKTLEMGVALCVTRTNYNVELEHWLFCLADRGDSDFVRLLESFQIDVSRVKADLTKSLDRLRTGNAKSPGLSPEVIELAQREAVTIEKHGRPVAVVISPARHEELLDAWEESQDVAAFDAARADDTVPWEQVKADLGWT